MKKLFTLFAAVLMVGSMMANSYWYRGNQNGWGATAMTVSEDGYYEYISALSFANNGNVNNYFKIALSAETWEYNGSYLSAGFNNTDITDMGGNWNSDNAGIYHTSDYYVLVYYPNTDINASSNPVICASTTLPDNTPEVHVYRTDSAYYLIGTISNNWENALPLTESQTLPLTADSTYAFKVQLIATTVDANHDDEVLQIDTTWLGNNGTMTRDNSTGWTMESNTSNCQIIADQTGEYVFAFNAETKQISVTYPELYVPTLRTDSAYFLVGTISNNWENALSLTESQTLTLTADSTYAFKVQLIATTVDANRDDEVLRIDTTWLGNNGTMTRDNSTGWTLEVNTPNCQIIADQTGAYQFTFDTTTNQISVEYPTATDCKSLRVENGTVLCLEKGRLVIRREGNSYIITGAKL